MPRRTKTSKNTRERIRDMAIRAMRDHDLSASQVRKLVHDALGGATKQVKQEIPTARRKEVREAFEGLRDAFDSVASAGINTGKSATRRGKNLAKHALPNAQRKLAAANEEFLNAVSSFAKKTSNELGAELESLVRRARKAGRSIASSATQAGRVASKDSGPLARDAGRAGWSLARKAVEQIALAASGLMEGIGQLVSPHQPNPAMSSKKRGSRRAGARKTRTKSPKRSGSKATRRKKVSRP